MKLAHRSNRCELENFVTNDVASHDAMLHPAFVTIQSNGARIDRATYLTRWAAGFDPEVIIYWDVRDENITLIGNVALVRSTNKHIMRRDGREDIGMTTYTDIYLHEKDLNQNDCWQCIQAQITPIAPGQEPSDNTIISVYLKGIHQGRRQ